MAPAKSAAELRSAWTGEGTRPHTCTAIAPGIRLIYIEQDVYHRRTIRTSGSNHGKVAGSGRMPVGSRTDLRHHQALHAGRDLRSPRSDRQSRLAGIDGRIGRPAVTGAVLFANGKRGRALLGGRCAGPAIEQTGGPASACVWRRESRYSCGNAAQLGSAEGGREEEAAGGRRTQEGGAG